MSKKGSRAVPNQTVLLKVDNLVKHFPVLRGILQRQVAAVHAVDGISFEIFKGETFGLVGESGCGKSTVGRTILQFYRPTAGHVFLDGIDLAALKGEALRRMRRRMQMIFQDPYASLDPRMTVNEIISEPFQVHGLARPNEVKERVVELLNTVRLSPDFSSRYPHEFSGGQRQRLGIARALALNPDFIVCDEPISALDVSIQAQVINLLEELQEKLGLTYLFIAHDLSMVRHISDRVAVMYLGVIVELGTVDDLFGHPLHPYTQALLSAVPVPDPEVEEQRHRVILEGDVPSPVHPPSGCRFRTRCPLAIEICARVKPELREIRPSHWASCHLVEPGKEARL
jgi:oligopeptide transport system ATP-binding protein